MMTIVLSQESADGSFAVSLTDGKTTVDVYRFRSGVVNAVVRNASHEAHRGTGRVFPSWESARNGYKSESSRALISAAQQLDV